MFLYIKKDMGNTPSLPPTPPPEDWIPSIGGAVEDVIEDVADFTEHCAVNFSADKCKKYWRDFDKNIPNFDWAKEIGGVIYDGAGKVYNRAGGFLYDDSNRCYGSSGSPIDNMLYQPVGPLATTCRFVDGLGTVGGWLGLDDAGNWIDRHGTKYLSAGGNWVKDQYGGCYTQNGTFDSGFKVSNFGSAAGKCIPGSNWVGGDIIPGGIEGITNFVGLDDDKIPDWLSAGIHYGGHVVDGVFNLPVNIVDKAGDFLKDNLPFDECALIPKWVPKPSHCNRAEGGGDGTFGYEYTGVIDQAICEEMSAFDWDEGTNLCVLSDTINREDERTWPENFENAIKQCSERSGEINMTEPSSPDIPSDSDYNRPDVVDPTAFSKFEVKGAKNYNNLIGFSRFEDP